MVPQGPVIVWFRDDLRLADHPALAAAGKTARPLVCLYILDEESPGARPLGGAARWWLAQSLRALDRALQSHGQRLVLRRGQAAEALLQVADECGASTVYWNRRYDRPGTAADEQVIAQLQRRGIGGGTFAGGLLVEPDRIASASGGPMRVFTPFWKRLRTQCTIRAPLPPPSALPIPPLVASDSLPGWALEPSHPDWAGGLRESWSPGEAAARTRLAEFLDGGIRGYAGGRDRPDRDVTSRLSPYLRFGEISPVEIWHAAQFATDEGRAPQPDIEKFLSELGWREFSHHLLHHFPDLPLRNLQRKFDRFPWREDTDLLHAWQRGRTGYPLVDAGMRQLWQSGWMHNRVRMLVASFLVKHLLIDWRRGEEWFWDTLVDADTANNAASWQWVAGSGADAAPYFRIFNPVLQGEKFDPAGDYVRRFVPELAGLPGDVIHRPWAAPPPVLARAGVMLGKNYPHPLVDHETARNRALESFATIRI